MTAKGDRRMIRPAFLAKVTWAALAIAAPLAACAPTVHVKVDPISIYAKLDADVRIKLDREVETAIKQNPDLF
jgi:hypothetical protein